MTTPAGIEFTARVLKNPTIADILDSAGFIKAGEFARARNDRSIVFLSDSLAEALGREADPQGGALNLQHQIYEGLERKTLLLLAQRNGLDVDTSMKTVDQALQFSWSGFKLEEISKAINTALIRKLPSRDPAK